MISPEHDPCCSSHGVPMSCERYRRTHFVEIRPCCAVDAARLREESQPVNEGSPVFPRGNSGIEWPHVPENMDPKTFPRDKRGEVAEPDQKERAGTPRFPRDSGPHELRGQDLNL